MSSCRAGPGGIFAVWVEARTESAWSMRSPSAWSPFRPPDNLDVKPLEGHEPWLRLRVGVYRVLYRPLNAQEVNAVSRRRGHGVQTGYLVARIVHRRELERAVATLA